MSKPSPSFLSITPANLKPVDPAELGFKVGMDPEAIPSPTQELFVRIAMGPLHPCYLKDEVMIEHRGECRSVKDWRAFARALSSVGSHVIPRELEGFRGTGEDWGRLINSSDKRALPFALGECGHRIGLSLSNDFSLPEMVLPFIISDEEYEGLYGIPAPRKEDPEA